MAKPLGGDLRVSMTAALPKAVETGLAIDDAQGWAQGIVESLAVIHYVM